MQPQPPEPPLSPESAERLHNAELYESLGRLRVQRGLAYARRNAADYRINEAQLRVVAAEMVKRVEAYGPQGPNMDEVPDSKSDSDLRYLANNHIEDHGMPTDENRQAWSDRIITILMRNASIDHTTEHYERAYRSREAGEEVEHVDLPGAGNVPLDEAISLMHEWASGYEDAVVRRATELLSPSESVEVHGWLGHQWDDRYARVARGLPFDEPFDPSSAEVVIEDPLSPGVEIADYRFTAAGSDSWARQAERSLGKGHFARHGSLDVAPDVPDCPELIGYLFAAQGAKNSLDAALLRHQVREMEDPIDVGLTELLEDSSRMRPELRPTKDELLRAVHQHTIDPALRTVEEVRALDLTRDIDGPDLGDVGVPEPSPGPTLSDGSSGAVPEVDERAEGTRARARDRSEDDPSAGRQSAAEDLPDDPRAVRRTRQPRRAVGRLPDLRATSGGNEEQRRQPSPSLLGNSEGHGQNLDDLARSTTDVESLTEPDLQTDVATTDNGHQSELDHGI